MSQASYSRRNRWTSRCAVECGVGGPLAGLVSYRILQASTHSAAGRAGTILDGNIRNRNPNSLHPPSGMVDPLSERTIPPSLAEPKGQRDFALHPATSARTRCIHRASVNRIMPIVSNRFSKRAGGHGGPPLRGILYIYRIDVKAKPKAYRTNMAANPNAPPRRGCSVFWYAKRRYSHPSDTSCPSS